MALSSVRQRLLGLLPGTVERRRQILGYAEAWAQANEDATWPRGGCGSSLGDSTAQAVGATGVDRGYVGLVRAWLEERGGAPWRVVNLSKSGARAGDRVGEVAAPRTAEGIHDALRPVSFNAIGCMAFARISG